MSKPFFLTRQIANLIEDFAQDLESGSLVLLLYGETGVGKTRLLRELCRSRLSERKHHWVDMNVGKMSNADADGSHSPIDQVFKAAGQGDLIIADHYEGALKKDRHQLILRWSKEGKDKGVSLVIVSDGKGFGELRKLSQQYQVEMRRYQQMPYNADEVLSFLNFYLHAEQPCGNLSIPGSTRKRLDAAKGIVQRIIEVADQDSEFIESKSLHLPQSAGLGSRVLKPLLVVLAIAIGGGWYLSDDLDISEIPSLAGVDTEALTDGETTLAAADPVAVEAEPIEVPSATKIVEKPQPIQIPAANTELPVVDSTPNLDDSRASPPSDLVVALPADEIDRSLLDGDFDVANVDGVDDFDDDIIDDSDELVDLFPNDYATDTTTDPVDSEFLADPDLVAPSLDTAAVEPPPDADTTNFATLPEISLDPNVLFGVDAADEPVDAGHADTKAAVTDPDKDTVIDTRDQGSEVGSIDAEPLIDESNDKAVLKPKIDVAKAKPKAVKEISPPKSTAERFALELQKSTEWINRRQRSVGTVQILLLSAKSFNPDSYFRFVEKLAARKIDTDLVRVFKTLTAGTARYSVVYGEFKTRKQALKSLRKLPKAIRDASPIARSVGGLRDEIKRLQAKG